MHGAAFLASVEQVLARMWSPGDIVVLDHLPTHRPAAIRQATERIKAELRFLPSYIPDYNPIEAAFSKFKACLKKHPARVGGDLWDAVAEAPDPFTRTKCERCFVAAGNGRE